MSDFGRRTFIRGAGAVAAGVALGACSSDDEESAPVAREDVVTSTSSKPAGDPLDTFDHVVVVMFENRSLDNLLGGLYGSPGSPDARFSGVFTDGSPGYVSNPSPGGGGPVYAAATSDGTAPSVDPGECWPDINAQLFGAFNPETNNGLDGCPGSSSMAEPWNLPSGGGSANMQGFVLDYQSAWKVVTGSDPSGDDVAQIMQYFSAETLPVTNALAKSFGVFDHWFCDVPSDTFVNRSFFHAASSTGLVTEPPYSVWPLLNTAPTLFNRMNDADVSWNVFFDPFQIVSGTLLINFRSLWDQIANFKPMDSFYSMLSSGDLPQYSFIEPRMHTADPARAPENDMHPTYLKKDGRYVVSDVRRGDVLLHEIYDAIRTSPVRDKTLLMMVFDEHGGMHDHVVPPPATPPGDGATPQYGFGFDRLGVRIPAIAISSFVPEGTVVNDPMQNTSVIRTLSEKWSLAELTERSADAPRFDGILDPASKREWPTTTPPQVSDTDDSASGSSLASGLGRAFLGAAQAAAEALPRLQAGDDVDGLAEQLQSSASPAELTADQLKAGLEQANETLQIG